MVVKSEARPNNQKFDREKIIDATMGQGRLFHIGRFLECSEVIAK